ncbi:hypothetical protein [Roseovarius autotrophicus]|uniref:hypothetical protein n=1 Tax=Roseovarius autotrophicus TaxID=2824121 RepID=UPI001A0AE8A7|nr:hypothetical protein [Roseovarius autotrophicus]MBE0452712.1 hypothetical protein [Roseovarius sp.]
MGLTFLAFFWVAGVTIAVALGMGLGGRRGPLLGVAIAGVALLAILVLFATVGWVCEGTDCGGLSALMGRLRLLMGALTAAGLGLGLWLGARVRVHNAPQHAGR